MLERLDTCTRIKPSTKNTKTNQTDLPRIQSSNAVMSVGNENSNQVDENGFPDSQFKFVHKVGDEQLIKVESMFKQKFRKRILEGCLNE